jgi:hypothetical protein
VNAEQLRDQLGEVLAAAGEPMTTGQARPGVTEYCRGRPVVPEEVCRTLVIPARRGAVRRAADQPGRGVHWESTRHHVRRLAAG